MVYLIKIFQVVVILGVTYFWNNKLLKKVYQQIKSSGTKNSSNQYDSPLAIKNDANIIRYVQYFYWFVGIVVSVILLLS